MNILIMKLCFVFVVIIAILWMKRPLFWAISGGLAAALVLYGIRVPDALSIMGRSMVSKDTVTVVLGFYFITFLQRMLERRNRLKQAEQSLNWLFNNRRVNASAAPAVIGLLPSAGAMTICAEIVRSSCQDYLSNEDMTCVTSFYRHIDSAGCVWRGSRGICTCHAAAGGCSVLYRAHVLSQKGSQVHGTEDGGRQEKGGGYAV